MSLHAQPSPEVLIRLKQQQRNSSIVSIIIAVLIIILLSIVFLYVLLPAVKNTEPELISYSAPVDVVSEITKPKPIRPLNNKPVPPAASSRSMSKNIVSQSLSNIAIATPEEVVMENDMDFGDQMSFDETWGDTAEAIGSSSVFGDVSIDSKGLRGSLYDFKQTKRKKVNKDYTLNKYGELTKEIAHKNYSKSAFKDYFQAPNTLVLSSLAIPLRPADDAPKYFGAETEIEPKGWMAHYTANLIVPKKGRYRFIGMGDDYITIKIDGEMVLVACFPSLQDQVTDGWEHTEDSGKWSSPFGRKLIHGTWLELEAGQQIKMDLAIGERPGGHLGFILMIEEDGVRYDTAKNGRPILPIFTTKPFSRSRKNEIQDSFGEYEFEWSKVPVFAPL